MANPSCLEPVPCNFSSEIDLSNPNLYNDLDSLQFPPLDTDFLTNDLSLPEGLLAELGFDDDFDFSFDDISLPPENEDFIVAEESDVWSSSISVECLVSGDRNSEDVAKFLNSPSPDSLSCDRELSGPVSSQDSGGCRSGVAGVLNSPSPNSGGFAGSASSSPKSCNFPSDVVDQKIKLEEEEKGCLSKRKKENEEANPNPRNCKLRRSISSDNSNSTQEEEKKKKTRLMRNRESAQLSRQRKKHYVEELEDKLRSMHSTVTELNSKISFIMAENASLRQQLGGGVCVPPPGVYPPPPMAPMPYPWVPCASYAMRTQGSQVPLVPIPRLKPQQPVSVPKAKKSESKKSEGKTKKVASVSFLGLLFFMLLFGGLVPFVNVRYGGNREMVSSGLGFANDGFSGQPPGRVLTVSGRVNGSDQSVGIGLCTGKSGFVEGNAKMTNCKRDRTKGAESEVHNSRPLPGSDGFVRLGNASEPLVASLYVPRNDKLVKIDGNLIIHSVLASEKAMASSRAASGVKSGKVTTVSSADKARETGLAIAGNWAPALAVSKGGRNVKSHPHLYRSSTEQQKALTSSSRDAYKENSKSTPADRSLQQWFRESLAGPILSSGMCTEVFQFDVSQASANSGGIIPATSIVNVSATHPADSAHLSKRKNRRTLYRQPIPIGGSALNETEERAGRPSQNGSFQGNKSVSSMVVSVLVDPREAGDTEGDGVISPKSLSSIFVVVLLDSAKYVTYSCVLPLKGSSTHLVTT